MHTCGSYVLLLPARLSVLRLIFPLPGEYECVLKGGCVFCVVRLKWAPSEINLWSMSPFGMQAPPISAFR